MDSPEQSKSPTPSTAAPSSFSPVQESPFSNYVSNLSPIKHDKAPHVAPRFLGLNSPPLVFTSPRINTLKRCQSLSFEVSRNGKGDKISTDRPGDLGLSVIELQQELIVDIKKDDDTNNSMSVQPSSSSGCVDEYLADPVDVDCANSAYSVDVTSLQSNNVLESSANGLPCSKDLESDDKHDVGREVDVARLLPGHSEQGVETFDVLDPLKIKNDQHGDRGISDECQQIESDMLDLSSKHGSLQAVQAYDDFVENAKGVKDDSFYEMTCDLEEANEHRGMSRRCLQFGESQPESTANCSSSPNLANVVITSTTSAKTGHVDLSATSRKGQLVNLSQLVSNMITQNYDHRSSLTVSKPSGIVLHLNSVINAIPADQGGIASMKLEVDSMGTRGIKSTSIMSYQSMENMESCSDAISTDPYQSMENMESCSDAFENVSTAHQDGTLEAKVHTISGSAASESLCIMESTECHTTLDTKKRLNSGDGVSNEVFNQQSPKKKRKKLPDSTYGDGCKRCNCKKSKCLKLYCDCFAAGIYCAEPCSCQGCFNKPEYEDKVLETRQLIESRNPLAFAPKVVKLFTEVPVNSRDDGSWKTPSSARHKRGCNCKRSMCLKKYCECYQANVGCSLGCRCEGCKNVYGKKEDYSVTEGIVNRGGGQLSERRVSAKKNFLHSEMCNPHYLTPMTPSVQCSEHGNNAPVSELLTMRCFPSLESDPTNLSFAKSPRSNSNDMLVETSKENLYIGSYCEGINNNNAEMLADECHQTPLPNHPSFIIGSSSKATELLNLGPRSGCFTSGGLRWCSSPITPKSPVDGTKELERLDSDELFDILVDDTPEMLKDTSTPFKTLKASSPNGKRVSPPHRLHQLRSSSSGPLRSGRRFLLKAVPSFPPLTPCINSKGSGNESRNNFQDKSIVATDTDQTCTSE